MKQLLNSQDAPKTRIAAVASLRAYCTELPS